MRTLSFLSAAILIAITCESALAQLRIVSIQPRLVDQGETLVLRGNFGERERSKTVRFARVVDRQARFFYPTVRRWSPDRIDVYISRDLPADRYLVTIVYLNAPRFHSNNAVVEIDQPSPRGIRANQDGPITVVPNRCVAAGNSLGSSEVSGEYERSTSRLQPPCQTFRTITGVDARRAFPGGEITVLGDFGRRRHDQFFGLGHFEGPGRNGGSEPHLSISYLLEVVSWSNDRVTVRVHDRVRPDGYRLVILNRLSRTSVPGVFERGSNVISVGIRSN